ncbi:MAG: hypothetical protein RJA36_1424 [Pseudomonadota bacterium]|jgi:hypothetical protein
MSNGAKIQVRVKQLHRKGDYARRWARGQLTLAGQATLRERRTSEYQAATEQLRREVEFWNGNLAFTV